jgi:GMP synthase (glutamine-hydrolysing)
VAGARLLVLQPDASDPPGRLGEWLCAAGLELDVRDLNAGDPVPADLSGHAGVLVLGGPMGALDDAEFPYLAEVRRLLRTAVSKEVPTLGVCLGHQLLAAANGGVIRRSPEGPEIGAHLVAKRAAAGTDPLCAELPITPDVLQWHYDEVAVLPPGAIQLFSSPGCDLQAFRLGRLAWGLQFHIETTPEMVREWAADEADGLHDHDLAVLVERAVAAHDDIAEAWRPFAERFAAVVRDPAAVSPARPVPGSPAAPVTDPAAIRAALAAEAMGSRRALGMPHRSPPDLA